MNYSVMDYLPTLLNTRCRLLEDKLKVSSNNLSPGGYYVTTKRWEWAADRLHACYASSGHRPVATAGETRVGSGEQKAGRQVVSRKPEVNPRLSWPEADWSQTGMWPTDFLGDPLSPSGMLLSFGTSLLCNLCLTGLASRERCRARRVVLWHRRSQFGPLLLIGHGFFFLIQSAPLLLLPVWQENSLLSNQIWHCWRFDAKSCVSL